jgi:hypothetical protein
MDHLLDRDLPSIRRQPLLHDQIGRVAHSTTGMNQRHSPSSLRRFDRMLVILLSRRPGSDAEEKY